MSQLVVKPVYCFLYRQETDCIDNTHVALCTTLNTFLKNYFVESEMLTKEKKNIMTILRNFL